MQEGDTQVDGGGELQEVQVPTQGLHPIRQAVDVERFGAWLKIENLKFIIIIIFLFLNVFLTPKAL